MTMLILCLALLHIEKPVGVQADVLMDQAVWIAEATIVEVEAADWGGENGRRGRVRVQVTRDPARVFKGFAQMGRTLDLTPPAWGPQGCTTDLAALVARKETVLVAALKDGTFPFVGQRLEAGGWRLRSWCDYNAWWIWSTDKNFGTSVKLDGDWGTTLELTGAQIAGRYQGFVMLQTGFLLGTTRPLPEAELAKLMEPLGAEDPAVRDAATKVLIERGAGSIAEFRKAREAARDPEVQARLAGVLEALAEPVAAFDAAATAKKAGPDAEARILVMAHAAPDEELRAKILARLTELAAAAKLDPAGDAVKAWQKRLEPK